MLPSAWDLLAPRWFRRYWWVLGFFIISAALVVIPVVAVLFWWPAPNVELDTGRIGLAQLLVEGTAVLIAVVAGLVALKDLRLWIARPKPTIWFWEELGGPTSSVQMRIGDRKPRLLPLRMWNQSDVLARALKVRLVFKQVSDLVLEIQGNRWREERDEDRITWTWRPRADFVLHGQDLEQIGVLGFRRPDISEKVVDPRVRFRVYLVRITAYIYHETGMKSHGLGITILPPE